MRVAYITSGAAGMYCGSCMHDNTLARALQRQGVDVELIPTYTPIRTDEEDVSVDQVFFGGINIYLQQKMPLFRYLPRLLDRWFDNPRLLRWVSSKAMETSAAELGALTSSMLKGTSGYQRKEVQRLCNYLRNRNPDLVVFSNMLVAGCVPAIKEALDVPVLVTLQGDDIFLDDLPEKYRTDCLREIKRLGSHVDGYITNSNYYADFMADYLALDRECMHIAPLGIDTSEFPEQPPAFQSAIPPTIGYVARIAKEKGFHLLADAFLLLRQRTGFENTRLVACGWLGGHNQDYADEHFSRLKESVGEDFEYRGSLERHEKLQLLREIDVLSVPTVYRDPKGLFLLEALAAGAPVVQPEHGAFPELLHEVPGGHLVAPNDAVALADGLESVLADRQHAHQLGQQGLAFVHAQRNSTFMAEANIKIYRQHLEVASN